MNKILKKNFHILIFLFSIILLNLYLGINFIKKSNYTNNFLRLHVVANSNSTEDQIDKLKVSEKINEYIESLNIPQDASKENLLNILNDNSNEMLNVANSVSNYTSTLKIGKIKYDEKQSITYDMPNGTYDSIQIILGKGEGKNIWSLIFPNADNFENIKNYETIMPGISNLYENEEENICENNYTFKILEIIQNKFL